MANFDELIPKVQSWDVEDEEILINKIRQMTEDYQQKCSDLSINLNNMTRNLHLIDVDFVNTINNLKTISGNKFIEHIIDIDDVKPEENEEQKEIDSDNNDSYNTINSIVQRSLDFVAMRDQQKSQNKNNVEDDTVSMNSKVMDNNLMKNNRGLKLPMIIGTKDFNDNDYIGLVLDDEEEDENNFNNEIRNEAGIEIPKEGAQSEDIITNINNNKLNNNPEEFHNIIQQNMGKPMQSQNMFELNNNENEKEFINPTLVSMRDEEDLDIGGGLFKKTTFQPSIPYNMNDVNNMNPNLQRINTNNDNLRKTAINEKVNLSNFLNKNIFGDDDEDDEDTTGLFGRPKGMNTGFGLSMILNNNNMNLNNNANYAQNTINNNININNNNIDINLQNQNNNIDMNNINQEQQQENIPLNQRMEMAPSPLLFMKQNNINQQPEIIQNNNIEKKEEESEENLNDFEKKKRLLQKLYKPDQNPPQIIKPLPNNENINENKEINQESNINPNINNTMNNNNNIKPPISQKEMELEKVKSKINSIFGDDDDEEDDIFSKKMIPNKAEKIEEKTQNLQSRFDNLFNDNSNKNNNTNNILINNNDINNNQANNNININNNSVKKSNFFLDDDEDQNIKIPTNQNTSNNNLNLNITQPTIKNEPRIIMPKPDNQPIKAEPKLPASFFQEPPKQNNKLSNLFDEEENPKPQIPNNMFKEPEKKENKLSNLFNEPENNVLNISKEPPKQINQNQTQQSNLIQEPEKPKKEQKNFLYFYLMSLKLIQIKSTIILIRIKILIVKIIFQIII